MFYPRQDYSFGYTENELKELHILDMLKRYSQIGKLIRKGKPYYYITVDGQITESADIDVIVALVEGA